MIALIVRMMFMEFTEIKAIQSGRAAAGVQQC